MKQIAIIGFTITIDDSEEELSKEHLLEWARNTLIGKQNHINARNPLVDFSLQEVEVDWREIQIKNC